MPVPRHDSGSNSITSTAPSATSSSGRVVRDAQPGDQRGHRAGCRRTRGRRRSRSGRGPSGVRRGPVAASEGGGARAGAAADRDADPRVTPRSSSSARCSTSACRSRRCAGSRPARPQNFDYYAGVVTELHGRSFQVGDEFLNYTIRKPVGVAGLIMPWNAPLMLSTWRHRARARGGQHGRAQAGRVVAAVVDAAGRGARGGRPAARRLQRRARVRRDGRRAALARTRASI